MQCDNCINKIKPYIIKEIEGIKVGILGIINSDIPQLVPNSKLEGKLTDSELRLMRTLAKWPRIVEKASLNYAIHKIPHYVHTLSSDFNQFYRDCPVIGNKNENYRINLVCCTKKTLKEGLYILGIRAPERM